ncbi:hypothetical protein BSLG_004027 [Batrachochytrium salamandrivorans]|nr:hypothetical protein BSLG_004027 [Batrachochytrium salamandrivorans]
MAQALHPLQPASIITAEITSWVCFSSLLDTDISPGLDFSNIEFPVPPPLSSSTSTLFSLSAPPSISTTGTDMFLMENSPASAGSSWTWPSSAKCSNNDYSDTAVSGYAQMGHNDLLSVLDTPMELTPMGINPTPLDTTLEMALALAATSSSYEVYDGQLHAQHRMEPSPYAFLPLHHMSVGMNNMNTYMSDGINACTAENNHQTNYSSEIIHPALAFGAAIPMAHVKPLDPIMSLSSAKLLDLPSTPSMDVPAVEPSSYRHLASSKLHLSSPSTPPLPALLTHQLFRSVSATGHVPEDYESPSSHATSPTEPPVVLPSSWSDDDGMLVCKVSDCRRKFDSSHSLDRMHAATYPSPSICVLHAIMDSVASLTSIVIFVQCMFQNINDLGNALIAVAALVDPMHSVAILLHDLVPSRVLLCPARRM